MSSCWAYKSFRCFCVPYRKQYNPAIFILKLNVVSTACQWLIRPQFYGMYTFHFGKQFFMLEYACHMGLSVSFDHTPFQMKLNTKNTKNILWLSFMFCLAATVFYIVVYEKINYVNIRYLKDAINLIWYRFHLESSQNNCFSVF